MHEYVREWWENKIFTGEYPKNKEGIKKFEDHFGKRVTFTKRMEDRENLKNGCNFSFVFPKIGKKKCLEWIDTLAEESRRAKFCLRSKKRKE